MGLWTIMRLFFSGYNLVAYIIQRHCCYIFNVKGNLELEVLNIDRSAQRLVYWALDLGF